MGRRNRERIARIKAGLEQPFRAVAEKALEKVLVPDVKESDIKVEKVIKTKCPDITNVTEIKTCRQIMGMLANPKMPRHIIRDKTKEGMRKVVAKLKKCGETSESVYDFYWGIGEFRKLWGDLGFGEPCIVGSMSLVWLIKSGWRIERSELA